jgi:hypothetical protein
MNIRWNAMHWTWFTPCIRHANQCDALTTCFTFASGVHLSSQKPQHYTVELFQYRAELPPFDFSSYTAAEFQQRKLIRIVVQSCTRTSNFWYRTNHFACIRKQWEPKNRQSTAFIAGKT